MLFIVDYHSSNCVLLKVCYTKGSKTINTNKFLTLVKENLLYYKNVYDVSMFFKSRVHCYNGLRIHQILFKFLPFFSWNNMHFVLQKISILIQMCIKFYILIISSVAKCW